MPRLAVRSVKVMLIAILAWGAFVRVWNLSGRPFWADEAWVARTVRDSSPVDLLCQTEVPLPPLFAVATKLIGRAIAPPELAYRLLPALCGVFALPLVYAVARTLRSPRTLALGAAGLCASCLMLVIWSRELKHYSIEALVSVLAALLVFRLRRCHARGTRRILVVGIVLLCAISPWLAYGTVFPLGALLPILLILKPQAGSRRASFAIGATGLLTLGASLAGVWLLVAGKQAADPSLAAFTANWYIQPLDPHSWARACFYAALAAVGLFFPLEWFLPIFGGAELAVLAAAASAIWLLALLGLGTWPRRGRLELAAWLLGPYLAMLGAALFALYPFGVPRMTQFWAPPMIVVVAAGLARLGRAACLVVLRQGRPALLGAALLGVLPVALIIREPVCHCYHFYHDFPKMLATLERKRAPGEFVLVELGAVPCVRYYAPNLRPPVLYAPIAAGVAPKVGENFLGEAAKAARWAGPRFWVLRTYQPAVGDPRPLEEVIEREGYKLTVVDRGGLEGPYGGAAELLVATRR